MNTSVVPLDQLAQKIHAEQANLAALRREYERRQRALDRLKSRRKRLTNELGEVESQIQKLTGGNGSGPEGTAPRRPGRPPGSRQAVLSTRPDVGKGALVPMVAGAISPRGTGGSATAQERPARTARRGRGRKRKGPPFTEVLLQLLQKSRDPIPARELAEQARAAGYRSKSKNLTNVVWVALGKLKNVENVPGKGYRLKR